MRLGNGSVWGRVTTVVADLVVWRPGAGSLTIPDPLRTLGGGTVLLLPPIFIFFH